ncbi:DUF2322 family protein [Acidovorax sp. NCPPB 3576]|uniref:DUF2322 family protein n=1 Tax=Acidovorax sp. NCPPB 3576 TaxID=2940488 RepID=UPI00234A24DE|nr:DUF2322 family protein [Acidovorax sp. NCPPB 3576]WCM86530.1 DUF2322 family protein [Acidovorax sp. NCPPB 3576]
MATLYGGSITPAAARRVALRAHTAYAQAHSEKHPDIDRLMAWAGGTVSYRARPVLASDTAT